MRSTLGVVVGVMALKMLLVRVDLAGIGFVLGVTEETVLAWLRRAAQQAEGVRSQGSDPGQTQVRVFGVSRSTSIFLWAGSPLSALYRLTV